VVLAVEQEARQRLAQLGLAHAGGAQEQEAAQRPVRVGQAGALRRMASDTATMASSWPTTRSCSLVSICSSLSRSPCIILLTGMPVARLTTSAISSAPTWCAAACGPPFLPASLAWASFSASPAPAACRTAARPPC
jgi:hypothetical protein